MVKYSSEYPSSDGSLLQPLLNRIAECPALIAPEREAELGEVQKVTPWKYDFDLADGARGISANLDTNTINLPLAQLERLWAMTYGFLEYFDIGRKHPPGGEIGVDQCPEMRIPSEMLNWAAAGMEKKVRFQWPEHLPQPGQPKGADEELLEKVNRHFLGAVAFIILHEIGHLHYRHESPKFQSEDESIRCEFEADAWAAAWIMEKCPEDLHLWIFRADVCVLALTMINLVEYQEGPQTGKRTHPPTVERILRFSDRWARESEGKVAHLKDFPLYLAASILQTQRLNLGLDIAPRIQHDSMTDYLVDAMRVFRERKLPDGGNYACEI